MNAHQKLLKGFTFTLLQRQVPAFGGGWIQSIKWVYQTLSNVKKICRQIRKDEPVPESLIYELFLLVVSYATYREIDIQVWIIKRYPGFCIYCQERVCICTAPGSVRPLLSCDVDQIKADMNLSLRNFQKQDFKVYPNDRSYAARLVRAMHLFEEVAELLIEIFKEVLENSDIAKVTEEVVDVLERIISLASTLGLNMEKLILGRQS